jgi:hypothetical protein
MSRLVRLVSSYTLRSRLLLVSIDGYCSYCAIAPLFFFAKNPIRNVPGSESAARHDPDTFCVVSVELLPFRVLTKTSQLVSGDLPTPLSSPLASLLCQSNKSAKMLGFGLSTSLILVVYLFLHGILLVLLCHCGSGIIIHCSISGSDSASKDMGNLGTPCRPEKCFFSRVDWALQCAGE